MQSLLSEEAIIYDGTQLRSGWIEQRFAISGDAVVAFLGPCEVLTEHLVDREDQRAGAIIIAAQMLHLIAEQAPPDITVAVLRQRLLVALTAELLHQRRVGEGLRRYGDNIFSGERKLTVSIATTSPTAGLIHLGINVDPTGAPVPAIGLAELGVDPGELAGALLEAYVEEMAGTAHAQGKVRTVP